MDALAIQLEYYLSDDNLLYDGHVFFLLHLHGGELPLLTLATFKRTEQRLREMQAWLPLETRLQALQESVSLSSGLELCGTGGVFVRRPGHLRPLSELQTVEALPGQSKTDSIKTGIVPGHLNPAALQPHSSFSCVLLPAEETDAPALLRLPKRDDFQHLFAETLGTHALGSVVLAVKGRDAVGPKLYCGVAAAAGKDKESWAELAAFEQVTANPFHPGSSPVQIIPVQSQPRPAQPIPA